MNVLGSYLEAREDARHDQSEADNRWLQERTGIDPAERLQSWDRWIRRTLATTLVWPHNEAARDRLLGQCAAEMTTVAKQLRGRGWLLDGKALAGHVAALLEPIAKAQRAGKVGDFWPYFRASVSRYVGANAEEIQQQAKRTGADEGIRSIRSIGSILGGLSIIQTPSMTELLATRAAEVLQVKAETLRDRQARLRAQDRAQKAQATLF